MLYIMDDQLNANQTNHRIARGLPLWGRCPEGADEVCEFRRRKREKKGKRLQDLTIYVKNVIDDEKYHIMQYLAKKEEKRHGIKKR